MNTLKYPPVGISGRKRAGKNTVADAMVEVATRRGIPARISAFANPLRAVILAIEERWGVRSRGPPPTCSRRLITWFLRSRPGVRRHADA